ncbi:MAG: poly-gamma-glutamate capsule biosynthesis protein CapA/YwtB (metallophosphatase superfamily) [Chitinophagales bacterium]|jgi:poly-gamma-glutamate synthesis protein (capsule biosynthesis protein)
MRLKNWLIALSIISCFYIQAQQQYVNNDTSDFLKILLVGDLTINQQILDASYIPSKDQYDFQYIFHYIRPLLNLGDIVVGNLDNSFAQSDDYLESGLKSIPDEYGIALKYAGFNLLMNANRSAVHQELDDWKANKEFLNDINITQIGSFEHEEDRYERNPTIIEKYGIKIAFLNYIEGLPYYPELSPLVNGAKEEIIKRDLLLAKNRGADFTIVYMNWGEEYESSPNKTQVKLADLCIQEGANIVVGSNPRVVQDVNVSDHVINGYLTNRIIAYSLGDFVSTKASPINNSACILEVIVEKNKSSGVAFTKDVGYIPTFSGMYDNGGLAKYAIMPVSQVEKNNLSVPISVSERQWMSGASEQVRHKFSGELKEVEYELSDAIIDDVAEVLTVTRRPLNESKEFTLEVNNHLLLALGGFLEEEERNETTSSTPIFYEGITYKVQFLSLRREIPIDVNYYDHLKDYETYFDDDYFHYVIGNFKNLKQANDFCLDVKRNGHKYAYVVPFENGIKKAN